MMDSVYVVGERVSAVHTGRGVGRGRGSRQGRCDLWSTAPGFQLPTQRDFPARVCLIRLIQSVLGLSSLPPFLRLSSHIT